MYLLLNCSSLVFTVGCIIQVYLYKRHAYMVPLNCIKLPRKRSRELTVYKRTFRIATERWIISVKRELRTFRDIDEIWGNVLHESTNYPREISHNFLT